MRDHAALSASAAHPASNAPESARPPAALSTPPLGSLDSAAFLAGVETYAWFKTVDKSHVKKCFKTPPRPPKRLLDDPKRLGGLHNGCAFAAGAWCSSHPREEHGAVQSLVRRVELFVARQRRLASTGAAPITAAAG